MVVALSLLAACGGTPTPIETADTDDTDVTTVAGVTVAPTAMESVWRVTWDTAFSADGRVEYGIDGAYDHSATAVTTDGTHHEVLLAGLGAGETWDARAVSDGDGGEAWTSDSFSFDVPNPPSEMPDLTVSSGNDPSLGGFLLITNAYDGNSWVSIVDREGRRTWWQKGDEDDIISEAWLSNDGQYIYWMGMAEGAGELHKVSLDGTTDEEWSIPETHHDFVPLPDGTLALIRYDTRVVEGMSVYGDDVAIYDADGNFVRVVWSAWDAYTLDTATFPPDTTRFDWTHANGLSYDAGQNIFLLSLWDYSTIVGIDADTGETLWKLGNTDEFRLLSDEGFAKQHGPRLTEDGLMVFNNRDVEQAAEDRYSELVEFTVDWDAKTYTRKWSFNSDEEIYAPVLGNGDPLANGNTLLGWGSGGRAQELSPDHEVIWQMDSDLGGPFGYIHLLDEVAGATR